MTERNQYTNYYISSGRNGYYCIDKHFNGTTGTSDVRCGLRKKDTESLAGAFNECVRESVLQMINCSLDEYSLADALYLAVTNDGDFYQDHYLDERATLFENWDNYKRTGLMSNDMRYNTKQVTRSLYWAVQRVFEQLQTEDAEFLKANFEWIGDTPRIEIGVVVQSLINKMKREYNEK